MSIDEIVNEIIRLVRARDANGGHFHHEPYKVSDYFRWENLADVLRHLARVGLCLGKRDEELLDRCSAPGG
jgi:hypothetical protein